MMTVKSLLAENPDPSDADVRAALSSNLCRCTGYSQMYEAIRSAIAAERKGLAVPNEVAAPAKADSALRSE